MLDRLISLVILLLAVSFIVAATVGVFNRLPAIYEYLSEVPQ